ncbi:MAG: rhodanese-like domain-containing protein [Elainellaceae cyanobacterium]
MLGIPTPAPMSAQARAQDLKTRLDWGEPALTIVDARDRNAFNEEHIMGAVSMPMTSLVKGIQASLELDRDIYIYGAMDDETTTAAQSLRDAGYMKVAELRGGLPAWKAVGYPTELGS